MEDVLQIKATSKAHSANVPKGGLQSSYEAFVGRHLHALAAGILAQCSGATLATVVASNFAEQEIAAAAAP